MKLRNKKTGEIAEIPDDLSALWNIVQKSLPNSRVWEDASEEPKKYWYIGDRGEIFPEIIENPGHIWHQARKEIGNYFETKEEAEKAVEKLKAFKRLRDKGVVLHSCEGAESCENFYRIIFSVRCDRYWSDRLHSVDADLNLLLGGEE